jgi:hypothetical protein
MKFKDKMVFSKLKSRFFFIKIYEETIFIIKFFSKIKLIIKRN